MDTPKGKLVNVRRLELTSDQVKDVLLAWARHNHGFGGVKVTIWPDEMMYPVTIEEEIDV